MARRWDLLAECLLGLLAIAALAAASRGDEPDPLPDGAVLRLGTNALRHDHTVSALSFSADGTRLASASWDKTARVWDVASGREICRFTGHKDGASAVAISPDGRLAASGDMKRTTVLWDATTGKELHRTGDNPNTVFWLGFSADGKRLVWASGKCVRIWDVANWREERQIEPGDGVRPVVLAPDGQTLALGCEKGRIEIRRIDDGSLVKTLGAHKTRVFGLAFSRDGKRLVSGADGGEVKVWDVATGTLVHQAAVPEHWVRPVAFLDGGKRFAAAGQDGTIWMWETQSGREAGRFRVSARGDLWVMAMAVSPDGNTLATAGTERAIRLWDPRTLRPLGPAGHTSELTSAVWIDGGRAIATASQDGLVNVWDARTGERIGELGEGGKVGLMVAASADGRMVATSSESPSLEVFDGSRRTRTKAFTGGLVAMDTIAASADGSMLAVACRDMRMRVMDTRTGAERFSVNIDPRQFSEIPLAFAPDGRLLAIGSGDPDKKFVALVDTAAGCELTRLAVPAGGDHSAAFSPDGLTLALASWGKPIRLVEVMSGQVRGQIEGDGDAGTCVAFSPDGRLVAAGGGPDRPTVRVWSLPSGRLVAKFVGHRGWIKEVSFSPDSRRLLSASQDTTAMVWDVSALGKPGTSETANEQTLNGWWGALGAEDAAEAYRAIGQMTAAREAAVPFLVTRLSAMRNADSQQVKRLIAALNADAYAERQAAQRALAELGEAARPAMREALAAAKSDETRAALSVLIARLDRPTAADAEKLRVVRAIEVLERVGAAKALEKIARASEGSFVGDRCKTAAARIRG